MVKRSKAGLVWVSNAVHFADEHESIGPEQSINVRHKTFDVGPAGSCTTRVSYISTAASPSKPSKLQSDDNIAWNTAPLSAISALDEYSSMDAGYVNYIEEVTGLLPKRKRTAGVCACLIAIRYL
jgi:hypothetical protein